MRALPALFHPESLRLARASAFVFNMQCMRAVCAEEAAGTHQKLAQVRDGGLHR